jgi:hypothetical protein
MGCYLIGIILIIKFFDNLSLSHLLFNFEVIGFNLSNSLSLAIFNKSLKFQTLC